MGKVATLRFHTLPTGCIVCVSHKRNHDGYFRYTMGSYRKGEKFGFMFHRWVWENQVGPIPEGYEINHKCLNRGCCNVEHLECIDGKEHTIITNRTRKLIKK
ncbi:hypothetical protein NGBLDFOK_00025 [Dickeya phage W2B]|uniref:HNH nuclease domain-containing protein n=1 Tax=Dickeya phage W2B TaxID=3049138 RepID=A0AA47KXG7_9CAUD|nr:hypothetical protein NGBLDFOK_00025 [Dickeya phage W2B]